MKKTDEKVVTITTEDGDLWEARKTGQDEPWTVCFPEGEFRFYGTTQEVIREMKRVMCEMRRSPDAV